MYCNEVWANDSVDNAEVLKNILIHLVSSLAR